MSLEPLPGEGVDLRALKAEAARLLPPDHPLRKEILAVPDALPAMGAAAILESLLRIIHGYRDPTRGGDPAALDTLELLDAPFYDEAPQPGRTVEQARRR